MKSEMEILRSRTKKREKTMSCIHFCHELNYYRLLYIEVHNSIHVLDSSFELKWSGAFWTTRFYWRQFSKFVCRGYNKCSIIDMSKLSVPVSFKSPMWNLTYTCAQLSLSKINVQKLLTSNKQLSSCM